jgi:hypothetical protein
MQRKWEAAWEAYKAAEADCQAAVEEFKKTPPGDEPSRAKVLAAGRKRNAAWKEFGRAFDDANFD